MGTKEYTTKRVAAQRMYHNWQLAWKWSSSIDYEEWITLMFEQKNPQPDLTRPEAQPHSSLNVWQRTESEFQFILHIWAHTKAYMVLIKIKDIFSHLKEHREI